MAPHSSLRRRRSYIEDEEHADIIRGSQSPAPSTSSKRARQNGYGSDSTTSSESPEPEASALHRPNAITTLESGTKFQVGSIVRVKLIDFVTYARAEFFPGPNLNMVIGPNGTGKSSLVCAICLGLGWGPIHLGRAGQIGEFVKHNQEHAFIEIELQGLKGQSNHVVKVKIIKDGNGREWWLNGKRCPLKEVQQLCKSLSIQIDNLCQFLPQDKVSEFAALSPVELLLQTQRAAAPPEMLAWHENLKTFRKEQKTLEEQETEDKETLARVEGKMASLQAQKAQLEEINSIKQNVVLLKQTLPFLEYRELQRQGRDIKARKTVAQERLQRLKDESQPSLEAVNRKTKYRELIGEVINSRKKALQRAEQGAETAITEVEQLDTDVKEFDQCIEAEKISGKQRSQDVIKSRNRLRDLEAQLRENVVDFNGQEWNEKIRAKEVEIRGIHDQVTELKAQNAELGSRGRVIRDEKTAAEQAIADSQTQEGQQVSRITEFSKEAAQAWRWIQDHRDEFEEEVYPPAVISCAIKKDSSQFISHVEASLGYKDFLAFTAQTQNDRKKLSDQLNGIMGLADLTIRMISVPLAGLKRPPISPDEMRRCGLDGWALDYIDGPEPVLAMLCNTSKINATGISLKEVTEEQHEFLVSGDCNSWVAGNTSYRVNRRKDYGAHATSTVTKPVGRPRFWTQDHAVDSSVSREASARIMQLDAKFEELRQQIIPIRAEISTLEKQIREMKAEVAELSKEKNIRQKAHGEWMSLPKKIDREKENSERLIKDGTEMQKKINSLQLRQDHSVVQKMKKVLAHKKLVEVIRTRHVELLDAKVRFIEADSDVESLAARNRAVLERIDREEQFLREVLEQMADIKLKAKRVGPVAAKILEEAKAAGTEAYFQNISSDVTIEEREAEIDAEEARLQYMHANNPNAIRQFEACKADHEKLKTKVDTSAERLETLHRQISKIRELWEPALDQLISEISEAFSYNFEQIGCAGEIGIHKDEDFDQWAIQIKVKFRQSESLQILDQHRQSGGERSVSTIFYLMSLQSLAQSPFRVVDEINQGMDPRNERMVHERMVEIACNEHTSQYFLITPKLLTGLRYDRLMKTHVINSGEHVFEEANKRFSADHIIRLKRAMIMAR